MSQVYIHESVFTLDAGNGTGWADAAECLPGDLLLTGACSAQRTRIGDAQPPLETSYPRLPSVDGYVGWYCSWVYVPGIGPGTRYTVTAACISLDGGVGL